MRKKPPIITLGTIFYKYLSAQQIIYTKVIKEELEMLKDDLLIYSDPGFMESIKKGIDDAESGNTVKCEDRIDRKKLFESL